MSRSESDKSLAELLTEIIDLIGLTEEEALAIGNFNDLSKSEMHTLMKIGTKDTLSMSQAASRVGVTAGTLTVQVDRLVQKGYIERAKNPDDKRVTEIKLSHKGKVAVRLRGRFMSILITTIIDPLDEEQKTFLYETLEKVHHYLSNKYYEYRDSKKRR